MKKLVPILLYFLSIHLASAKVPSWWISRGVIHTNLPAANYAPVNVGQLKQIATQAALEMEAKLPNGAGDCLDIVEGFSKTNGNYLLVNQGQLKALAKFFYDRLIQEGYAQSYPWTETKADDANYALVNQGQVKKVFSFDLEKWKQVPENSSELDTDGDGLIDSWEYNFFGNLNHDGEEDPDGDGVNNQDEQENGTDPQENNQDSSIQLPEISYGLIDFVGESDGGYALDVCFINDLGQTAFSQYDGNGYWSFENGAIQSLGPFCYGLNNKGDFLLIDNPQSEDQSGIFIKNVLKNTQQQLGPIAYPGDIPIAAQQTPNLVSCTYTGKSSESWWKAINEEGGVFGGASLEFKVVTYDPQGDDYNTYYINESRYVYWPTPEQGFVIQHPKAYYIYNKGSLQLNNEWVRMDKSLAMFSTYHESSKNPNITKHYALYWSDAQSSYSQYETSPDCHYWMTDDGFLRQLKFGNLYHNQFLIGGNNAIFIGSSPVRETSLEAKMAIGNDSIWKYNSEKNYYQSYPSSNFLAASSLNDRYSKFWPMDINKFGAMVGWAFNNEKDEFRNIEMMPAELGVDANRDGKIVLLNEKELPEHAGYEVDRTQEGKYFRFWKNEDNDGLQDEEESVESNIDDCQDTVIWSRRDLEDFSRLWIYLKGVHEMVKGNDALLIGLKWKEVSEGSPAIRLFEAVETDGGDQYLEDETIASQQVQGNYGAAIEDFNGKTLVNNNGIFIFKSEIWESLSEENFKKYFIFEGVSEGKGKLQLIFLDKNQNEIGEAPPIYLDIANIKKMYQRSEGNQFVMPWDETDEAVIFVHGWNMSPEGSTSFAETMFKRLWHRGYKGRFAYFRWNTFWSDAFDNVPVVGDGLEAYLAKFNDSEYKAWTNGVALKNFANTVPKPNKNLVAHSMGNIVAGSALLKGMAVNNYVLLQAAVPAACYDDRVEIKQNQTYNHQAFPFSFKMWDSASPDEDSDGATRALAYRGRLKNVNVAGNMTSFFLPQDQATSFAWEVNNDQTKPPKEEAAFVKNFQYAPNNQPGKRLYKYHYETDYNGDIPVDVEVIDYYLTDPYEAMPYACRSWGKAAGAEGATQGSIDNKVDLSSPTFGGPNGFDKEHSAEFNRPIQKLKPFFDSLTKELDLDVNP